MKDRGTSLPPLSPEQWPAGIEHLKGGFAERLNVYRVMAHHPALLAAWAGLRQHLVVANALGAEWTEVVVLRASYHLGSEYERAHHIVRGRACGLSDERIAGILAPAGPRDGRDAVFTGAVDALSTSHRLAPEALDVLTSLVGAEGVLDLIAVVGFYTTLGCILNSFETPIDAGIVAELDERPFSG